MVRVREGVYVYVLNKMLWKTLISSPLYNLHEIGENIFVSIEWRINVARMVKLSRPVSPVSGTTAASVIGPS